jgi:hypothetical protein
MTYPLTSSQLLSLSQSSATHPLDVLLTPNEAAVELKVSESFLAKSRMSGTGPAYIQMGRAVRYSRSELQAYTAARMRTSTLHKPIPGSSRRAPVERRRMDR